jgi:hypothetical protein
MMAGLAAEADAPQAVMIDATCLKAHRPTSILRSKRRGSAAADDATASR